MPKNPAIVRIPGSAAVTNAAINVTEFFLTDSGFGSQEIRRGSPREGRMRFVEPPYLQYFNGWKMWVFYLKKSDGPCTSGYVFFFWWGGGNLVRRQVASWSKRVYIHHVHMPMLMRIAPDTDENGTQHYSLFGGGSFNGEGNHGLPEQADATAQPLVMLAATMLATEWFSKTTSAKKKKRKLALLAMRPTDRGDWPTTPMQQVPLGSHSLFAVRDMLKSSKHPDEWIGQITPGHHVCVFFSITSSFQP